MTDGFGFDDRTADAAIGDTPTERVVAKLKKLNADPVRFDFGDEDVVRFVDRQWERVFGQGDEPRMTTFETFRPRVTRDDAVLDGPVGAGAPNHPLDGFRAKKLLNRAAGFRFRPGEEEFGEVGPRVVSAIKRFQADRGLTPDGVIQPGGPTIEVLGREAQGGESGSLRSSTTTEFPKGKGADRSPERRGSTILTKPGEPIRQTVAANRRHTTQLLPDFERHRKVVFNERPEIGSEAATRNVPIVRNEKLRVEMIKKNLRAEFPIKDDNKRSGRRPAIYELHNVGWLAIKKYDHIIREEAKRAGIDPDIIRAIVYVENARGYYDEILDRPGTVRPMNINPELWEGLGGLNRRNSGDPRVNIRAGAILLRRIRDRIKEPNIRKIAAIYNFTGKESTGNDRTGYIARVAYVFRHKLWKR